MIDEILQRVGLKYEDLDTPGHMGERESLDKWLSDLGKAKVTIETIKTHIARMKYSVEMELTNPDLTLKQDLFLKARLRNYLLLEGFLQSPERAKEQVERNIASKVPGEVKK